MDKIENEQPAGPVLRVPPGLLDVSVLIVNWNNRTYLRECLDSVLASRPFPRMEVIVVDNGSCDGSPEMIKTGYPGVTLLANRENRGYARAMNQALALSRGRMLALADSGLRLPANALPAMMEFLENHPEAGVAGLQLESPDGSPRPHAFGEDPRPLTILRRMLTRTILRRPLRDWRIHRVAEVDWTSGAFLLVRREAREQTGDFDENFFSFFEDLDWCRRIRQAGWKVLLNPRVSAVQAAGRRQTENLPGATARKISLLYYANKHYGFWSRQLLRCLLPLLRAESI